jgi:hypothetical protein
MKNLIAFIAESNQIEKENLATELLAELIRSPLSERAFRNFVSSFGITLPDIYLVETQKGGIESRCIPDLWISDTQGNAFVIIDSKFYARFTHHQPNSYIKEVIGGGLLLFVVPDKRSSAAFTELCDLCNSEIKVNQVQPRQAKIGGTNLAVSTWTEILDALEASSQPLSEPYGLSQYNLYLNELRGFCDVASKEVFSPLTGEQIAGSDIALVLHQFKWLTENIIRRCIENNILQTVPKKNTRKGRIGANFDSSLFFGQNLIIDNLQVWLGFYGSVWEERQKSPLWIEIDSKSDESRTFVRNLRRRKGDEFVMQGGEDDAYLIAIPLMTGLTQSEQVESAVRFVADLKTPELESVAESANAGCPISRF